MDLVVSHASAMRFWSRNDGRLPQTQRERFPEAMAKPVHLTCALKAELAAIGLAPTGEQPLDLLFWGDGLRSEARDVRAHALFRPLPRGALVRASEHVLVASPELTYVQLARMRSVERLIMAGCELCGTYRLFSTDGRPFKMPEERRRLTSVSDIAALLRAMGLGPDSAASQGLRHVFDDARSPMEAKVALLLCLPPRLGGFGLPRPALNVPVQMSRSAYALYPRNPCKLDLYWEAARMDVEYDGKEAHGPEDHAKDVARTAALSLDDIEVLTLTKAQVYDRRAFALLAEKLERRVGHAPRKRPDDFVVRQMRLRRELDLL